MNKDGSSLRTDAASELAGFIRTVLSRSLAVSRAVLRDLAFCFSVYSTGLLVPCVDNVVAFVVESSGPRSDGCEPVSEVVDAMLST